MRHGVFELPSAFSSLALAARHDLQNTKKELKYLVLRKRKGWSDFAALSWSPAAALTLRMKDPSAPKRSCGEIQVSKSVLFNSYLQTAHVIACGVSYQDQSLFLCIVYPFSSEVFYKACTCQPKGQS